MTKKLTYYIAGILLAFSANQVAADLDEGLVAYYPFNGNAHDESGNGYHGIVQGALITADRFGKLGAYGFDGQNDRIKLNGDALNSLNSLTIALWLQSFHPGSEVGNYWFSAAHSGIDNEFLVGQKYGKILLQIKGKDHNMSEIQINDNTWHHLVFTREGSIVTLYLDGDFHSNWDSAPVGNLNVEQAGLWLGGDQDSVGGGWESGQQFDGLLDDLRIYNRVLDKSEIQALYQLEDTKGIVGVPATCQPATLSYDFKLHIPLLHYSPLAGDDTTMPLSVNMIIKNYDQLEFGVVDYQVIK
jgi:hypothetical protein